MSVPLLDLVAQYRAIKPEIDEAVASLFASQRFILGQEVEACEREIAAYSGASHGVGVSSGTDALLISLMAEDIGPGDEVITTPYTFFATAGSIARTGARPVFVDINPRTFNIDPEQIRGAITPRTRAIIPVHLFGWMANLDPMLSLAREFGLVVIEDAAQAIGAQCCGRRAGSLGDYGCFSFFPSKNLGGAGDGGMVVTQDPERAAKLAKLRNHGMHPKYVHDMIGGNFRLDALQAAVVRVKLRHLEGWTAGRIENARRYDRLVSEAGLADDPVHLPDHPHKEGPPRAEDREACRHIFNQYVIRVPDRDALRDHLNGRGIGHDVYYPIPLHLQACFAGLGYGEGDFPESERAARETLALPVFPELTDEQAVEVVDAIRTFYQ